jgi:hypothetical protein
MLNAVCGTLLALFSPFSLVDRSRLLTGGSSSGSRKTHFRKSSKNSDAGSTLVTSR